MSKRQTNSESVRANDPWSDTGTARLTDEGDSLLFAAISRYFKALGDIEQIRNDPGFEEAKKNAGEMVSGYHGTETGSEENKDFIRESLAGRTGEESLNEEINVIKHEISQSNINEISSQWVREWNEKKEWNSREDEKTEEIREFISDSLRRKTHRSFLRADTAGKTVAQSGTNRP